VGHGRKTQSGDESSSSSNPDWVISRKAYGRSRKGKPACGELFSLNK